MANQKYSSIKNDFCLTFDKNAHIEACAEDDSIKGIGFNFVTIDEINDYEQSRTVDTIGIVTQVGAVAQINIKNTGLQKDKRSVTIVDESQLQIQITFWGKQAARTDIKEGIVLAVKAARVSDYNGKSLNSSDDHTSILIEPKHKRTAALK